MRFDIDPRVEIVLEAIRNDLAVPTAAKLSELVNVSSSRFYELFKAEMRTSPARYRKTVNMEAAKVLSETTLLSVKEIAAKTGFNDLSHFVRDFKKHYGVTPTEYRKRNYKLSFSKFKATLGPAGESVNKPEDRPTNQKNRH